MYDRWYADELRAKLGRPYVHLLFGARQTGKSTLLNGLIPDGAEVDFIIEKNGDLTPVEVKWTEHPTAGDARHLLAFLQEKKTARHGYVICRCPRPLQLHEHVTALPWFCL